MYMLESENRLKKVRDFNLLMKYGRWANGQFLDLKYLNLRVGGIEAYFPKKEDSLVFKEQLKLAFAVGLKISKSAVKRNRSRRQISEVCRLLIKEDLLKTGYFLLLVAKKNVLEKNYAEISEEIKLLFNKSGVLKKV